MIAARRPLRITSSLPDTLKSAPFPVQTSRFNPIHVTESDEGIDISAGVNTPSAAPAHQPRKSSGPSITRQFSKKKMVAASKVPTATVIRKPLTMNIADFPALSRFTSKASSSRAKASSSHSNPIINQGISLDKSRYTGCGDSRFLSVAKQFLRDNRPDVVVFMEPRICGKRVDSVISALGFLYSYHIEAAGFSGGIWVAWYDTVDVTVEITHFQFIHFSIYSKRDKTSLYATVVYASPSSSGRKFLWPHLSHLASSIRCPWILFGDFNATLSPDDRKGCASSSKPSKLFQNLIVDHALRDMGYSGPSFTWSRGQAFVRLDRYICNSYFDESFPEAIVHHLLHKWLPKASMSDTIRKFTSAADTWNKTIFGYLATKKRIVMARLRGIQRYLSTRTSRFLSALEADLLIELEHLLDQEELLWKHKSRSDWISQGDRNTSYFHRRAISRRLRHKNSRIKLPDGMWCDDELILKEEATCFFKSLFADNDHPMGVFPISGRFPEVPHALMQSLDLVPTQEEIHSALMDMAPLKSPGVKQLNRH
ncbi:hypothetical protein V6N13_094307 [Hibiscus sabdariffa]